MIWSVKSEAALPVHDSLIAPKKHRGQVRQVMEETYRGTVLLFLLDSVSWDMITLVEAEIDTW